MSTADSWSTIRLHHLRDLLAVVETGSLRAAARKLGLTQPSLTKSLRQLEEQTALALLVRSKHGVTLTSAGQHLVERARLIESELRRTAEDLELLRGGTVRSVSVGVSMANQAPSVLRRSTRCAKASARASAWPRARSRAAGQDSTSGVLSRRACRVVRSTASRALLASSKPGDNGA